MADEKTPIFQTGEGILPMTIESRGCISENENSGRYMMPKATTSVKAGAFLCLSTLVALLFNHSFSSSATPLLGSSLISTGIPKDWSSLNESSGAVLITGATGRTGSLLYHELKRRGMSDVRAFVRDAEKAKTVLGCDACDESEGIFVGDLTEPDDVGRAMADGSVKVLAVASGASGRGPTELQRAIEFDAVISMVKSLGETNANNNDALRVVFCSSMGSTNPKPSFGGDILHWKVNAEAFLSSSGISSTIIIKPCGLNNGSGNDSTLVVGHHDKLFEESPYHAVSRQDVANVMAESVMMTHDVSNSNALRFDLCSIPGPSTEDLKGLIESSRWEWDN